MGQELLDISDNYYKRTRTRYFLATSTTGLRAVRGSNSKVYSHACIATTRSEWGWVTNLWSSREDLAKRNTGAYNKHYKGAITFETVTTQEITPKEARAIKKEINKEVTDYQTQKENNK